MFVELLSIIGVVSGFCLVTLAIASGLYYLSEIVEENAEFTCRVLKYLIRGISGYLILLVIFDSFPWKLTCLSLFTYFIYYQNLKTFPYINLTSTVFISSCILAVINHYLWFQHFGNPYIPSIDERLDPNFKLPHYPTFTEIASFFGICVWLIPFSLFISLSANENTLPTNLHDLSRFSNDNNMSINNSNSSRRKDDGDSDRKSVRVRGVNLTRALIGLIMEKINILFAIFGIKFRFGQNDRTHSELMI
ncbi:hypothetical protein BVG19_g1241 [[Candida] boidinii]|nr:hypothetical protein BVG19_g1241 [[Candida] boidinii]OWB52553.1 hypothetical protein B5S27_g4130 [[Candida] boidinii]